MWKLNPTVFFLFRIDLFDEIEYKAKRLAADGARLNANGTAVVNTDQQESVDSTGSICKSVLGIHNVSFITENNRQKYKHL